MGDMSLLSRGRPGRALARLLNSSPLVGPLQPSTSAADNLDLAPLPRSIRHEDNLRPCTTGHQSLRSHDKGVPFLSQPYHGFALRSTRLRETRTITEEGLSDGSAGDGEGKPKEDRVRILEAALTHVAQLGWTEAALAEGARDCGLSPSVLGILARKEAELVEFFMDKCREDLAHDLERRKEELSRLPQRERTVAAVRARLEMQGPYASNWPQALAVQARPANVPTTLRQRAELMDVIWPAVGDAATQMERHAKRLLLAGAYSAAEIYMLTDFSPGFQDTWKFLDRQVGSVEDMKKTAREASQAAFAIGSGISNTLSSLLKGGTGARNF